jgi:hypothetical protein
LKTSQAGLAAARRALQSSPSDPQLLSELSFLEAEAELWDSVPGPVGYDDPRAIKALETYAQRMEVGGCLANGVSTHLLWFETTDGFS